MSIQSIQKYNYLKLLQRKFFTASLFPASCTVLLLYDPHFGCVQLWHPVQKKVPDFALSLQTEHMAGPLPFFIFLFIYERKKYGYYIMK